MIGTGAIRVFLSEIDSDSARDRRFRDVFAEVLDRHMGLGDPSPVFPNYTRDIARYPGLFG